MMAEMMAEQDLDGMCSVMADYVYAPCTDVDLDTTHCFDCSKDQSEYMMPLMAIQQFMLDELDSLLLDSFCSDATRFAMLQVVALFQTKLFHSLVLLLPADQADVFRLQCPAAYELNQSNVLVERITMLSCYRVLGYLIGQYDDASVLNLFNVF